MSPRTMEPTLERAFRGHTAGVSAVAFNPNMKQVVSGGADATVMVWNFKLQQRPYRFVGHRAAVLGVACSPRTNLVASASKDRSIRLWKPTVHAHFSAIKHAHSASVRSVDFSSDGESLISASDDKTAKVSSFGACSLGAVCRSFLWAHVAGLFFGRLFFLWSASEHLPNELSPD